MKRLILATAVVGVAFAVGVPRSTEAAYVATMQQVGSDVVVNGTGSINLAGLTVGPVYGAPNSSWMAPSYPALNMGGGSGSAVYLGVSIAPSSFGAGGAVSADFGTGDFVGIGSAGIIVSPAYISGNPLNSSMTFLNDTFATLGVTVGTYVWSWGGGVNADTYTLNIVAPNPPVGVPAPPTLALFGVGLAGLLATRRRS